MSMRIKALCALVLLSIAPIDAAYAQAYSCYRPAELRLPSSGYTMTERDYDRVAQEAARYVADMQDYGECVRKEYEHAMDELEDVADRIERLDNEFSRK